MEATRSATVVWQGDLLNGTGKVSSVTTDLLRDLPVSWASRTEAPEGRTSPEELLAAAHSACFAMAMSGRLVKAGFPPDQLEVRADVTFAKVGEGWKVARSELTVRGRVPDIGESDFQQAAEGARDGCPVSAALKGNVELSVQATLER